MMPVFMFFNRFLTEIEQGGVEKMRIKEYYQYNVIMLIFFILQYQY